MRPRLIALTLVLAALAGAHSARAVDFTYLMLRGSIKLNGQAERPVIRFLQPLAVRGGEVAIASPGVGAYAALTQDETSSSKTAVGPYLLLDRQIRPAADGAPREGFAMGAGVAARFGEHTAVSAGYRRQDVASFKQDDYWISAGGAEKENWVGAEFEFRF